MDASGQNYKDTFRYTDVEYTPDGHTDVYRWDDFLGIAGGHVYSAMDTIDMVSTGGQYEGDEPEHAYACEVVGCCGLSDGVALFRPVSHDGADLIQIAFLRNDVDDATGAYTERFEAGSFDLPAADLPRSESRVDLLEYFSGRSFKHTPGVNRGLDPREAVDSIEDAIGCDLGLFDGFWLGVPGEADMRVGPYTKKSLLDFSYYAKELSCRYGLADSDILEIARHLPEDIPESIFDKLCASQGTTVEKVVNDPVTPFERSFREDIFNMPQNRPVGLAVLATLPLDAFLDASLSMICRGEGENAGTFTVKPGTYEPILGIYDPVGGCGGTMGTVLDCDFEIDPHDIAYTMMEPVRGEWKSDRIDLYTPQDCFGFSDPFGGRIEYSEKKPEIAVAVKPDPVELGHRASVAASSTAGGRARGAGIRQ